ncbi:MAG: doubled motif LPXTG anchor domain-containing protein, partial [Clostridiaceae bacterium]|nr:doubled motif LPXTG anchor domain-containing protein [Clostridiaceae bacterium]
YDGEAGNVLSGMIKGDGSLVLKVYFKQQFTVTYEPGIQGTFTAETTENLDYNAATPEFKGNTTGNAGYTFIGWLPEVAGTVTEDAVYVAQWAANDDTEYRIEYYYENAGTYSGTTGEYTIKRGTTDTLAEATAADKTPLRSGYVYDGEAGNVLTGMIKGDGSLVLKVYFKQQFTVKYQPGTHGTFTEQTYASLGYGDATPGFNGQITGAAGYEFGGWTPAVTSEVTQDAVYVATWNTKDSTKYTVEFYYQSQGAYPAAASSTQVRSGRTDEKAVVTDADKTPAAGYLLDTAAANVYEGSIAGDGSLVLRLYFKQQFTVTYEPGTRGTFAVQIHNGLSYHDKTPSFNGNTTGSGRYVFNGWDPVVADTVTGNVTYVAQWRYVGTSGGGGGNSGGGPNYNASGSSDGPGATVTVLPTEVPLANAPDTNNMIVIDDGLVPLAALPKTGDRSGASGWMLILSGLLLSAYTIVTKKKEEEN